MDLTNRSYNSNYNLKNKLDQNSIRNLMTHQKNIFDAQQMCINIFKNMAPRDSFMKVGFDQNSKLFWVIQNDSNTISFFEYLEENIPNLPNCEFKVSNIKDPEHIKIIQMDNKRQNYALIFDDKQCYLYPLFNKNYSTQRFTIVENKSDERIVQVGEVLQILSLYVVFLITNYGNIYFVQVCKQSLTLTSKKISHPNQTLFGKIKSFISIGSQQTDENAKVRCIYSQRLHTGCFLEMCYFFNGRISFSSLNLDYFQGEMRIQNQKEIYSGAINDIIINHEKFSQTLTQQQQQQLDKNKFSLIDLQFQYVEDELTVNCLTSLQFLNSEQVLVLYEIKLKNQGTETTSTILKEFNSQNLQAFNGKLYDPSKKLNLLYYVAFSQETQQFGSLVRKGQELIHDQLYVDDQINGIGGISKGLNTIGIYLISSNEGLKEINQIMNTDEADIYNLKNEILEEKRIQEQNNYIVPAGCNPDNFFNLLSIFQQNIKIEEKIKQLNVYLKKTNPNTVLQTLYLIIQEMKKEKTRNIVLAVSCKENDRRKSNQKFNQEEMFSIDNDIILYEINKKLQKIYHFKQFVENSDLRSLNQFPRIINACIDSIVKASIALQIRQLQISGNFRLEFFEEIFEAALTNKIIQDDDQQKSIDRLYINLDNIEFIFTILNDILINSILKSNSYQDDIKAYYEIWNKSINVILEDRQQLELNRLELIQEQGIMEDINQEQNAGGIENILVNQAIIFIEKSLRLLNASQNTLGYQLETQLQNICDFCIKETVSMNKYQVKDKILQLLIEYQLLDIAFTLCLNNNLKDDLYLIYFNFNSGLQQLKEYLKSNQNEVSGFIAKFIEYEKHNYSLPNKYEEISNFRLFSDFQEFNDDIASLLSQYFPNLYVLFQLQNRPIVNLNNIPYSESLPQNPFDQSCLFLFRALQRNIDYLKESQNPLQLPDNDSRQSQYIRKLELLKKYQLVQFDYLNLLNAIQNDKKKTLLDKINDVVEAFNLEASSEQSQFDNFKLTEFAYIAILLLYSGFNVQSKEYTFIIQSLKEIIMVFNIIPNQFFQYMSEHNKINNVSRELRVKIFEDIVKSIQQSQI
ncbi:AAA family ATPase (macronuclear) [Tetrahymena thermophila SB210]|uniref:AAA family ATPase n=1 Tax=Tetrahymena thermophila (strain SB210) TaxID=312017 RepID=I7M0X5_TETTS|nr:AAA family ATPase [Tetrahymena thermophila SB210]EAR92892.2 AAA family ATPase [Tetrahymena thermophila SB210]|eukprot:XP_001013137.2 AAA family ATPase [Tetrahymena thermophila SB210]